MSRCYVPPAEPTRTEIIQAEIARARRGARRACATVVLTALAVLGTAATCTMERSTHVAHSLQR